VSHDAAPGLIGSRVPRVELGRLLRGGGRYVGDITLPRMLHACFVRSPYAHAKIIAIDVTSAQACPGVQAVFTGADLNQCCAPFDGVAHHRTGH
jgi:carbon-monoxide dehydrogenase large subunit